MSLALVLSVTNQAHLDDRAFGPSEHVSGCRWHRDYTPLKGERSMRNRNRRRA